MIAIVKSNWNTTTEIHTGSGPRSLVKSSLEEGLLSSEETGKIFAILWARGRERRGSSC